MENFDKQLYKALKFFANNTVKSINKIIDKNIKQYRIHVSRKIERFVALAGYTQASNEDIIAITEKGIEQLRILEDIEHKDKSRIAAWVAIIVSSILSLFALIIAILALKGGN